MNALVMMTGPHLGDTKANGKQRPAWKVAVVTSNNGRPRSTVYKCLSYRRALSLSCDMAYDRKLRLHVEALPP